MSDAKPIPTEFDGIKFRSRLEARWAVAFKAGGIKYEYEYEGYQLPEGWYLPDFWLPRQQVWGEVKPGPFTPAELRKCQQLTNVTGFGCLLLWGPPDYLGTPATWTPISDTQFMSELAWALNHSKSERFVTGEEKVCLCNYDIWSRNLDINERRFWHTSFEVYPDRSDEQSLEHHPHENHPVEIARRHKFWNPTEGGK